MEHGQFVDMPSDFHQTILLLEIGLSEFFVLLFCRG